MKLWILNHYAVPRGGSGGTRHADLAHCLALAGHRVTIFASAVSHGHGSGVELDKGELFADRVYENDVRFRYVKTTPYSNTLQRFVNMLSFRRNVLRATAGLDQPDVIIGSSVHLHAADAGLTLAQRFKVPFVLEIRDIWPETLVDLGGFTRWNPVYHYLRRIELKLYRHAERIVGLLPGMGDYLVRQGIPQERFVYIPNGVDSANFPSQLETPPASGPFVLSLFGSHAPSDCLDVILRAAELLQRDSTAQNIRIQLIGDGVSKPELMRTALAMRLRNVTFQQPMSKPALLRHVQTSHAFIYNHTYMPVVAKYGMSANKIFEYLMLARPIVFACQSYNNPVAEAGAGVTARPNDAQEMAQAILQLYRMSAAERTAMGVAGRTWVIQHHDMPLLSARFEEMLAAISRTHSCSQNTL